MTGYIYVRVHPSYGAACKLGKASNIPDRDSQYATGEIHRGYFESVYEVKFEQMGLIERLLQHEFRDMNIRYNGGTEFYNKAIISLIDAYFKNFKYKKLSAQEIDDLVRSNRVRDTMKKINIQQLIKILNQNRYEPRVYQTAIINYSFDYFQLNDKGILIIPCGTGKTLISLWISQKLHSNTILIGVPNTLLLNQWRDTVKVLFPNTPYLMVNAGVDIADIVDFFGKKTSKCIVLTTYSSSHKVYSASLASEFVFDMKINDECHHLTAGMISEDKKQFIQMLRIPSAKQLSLTATLKQLDDGISNDNVAYFGQVIERKCLLWAIRENIICDYVIQTIITNEEQFGRFHIRENEQRLFLAAFSCLKSISDGHSHHALVYSNNKENSSKIIDYIKMLMDEFDIPVYYSKYHSEMRPSKQKEIISRFNESEFAIIACVYCLGEGYDNHNIDCVVFAENMQSNIRIVQSALRGGRKSKLYPNKVTKIICPILKEWSNENPDLKKVREIIYQMGLEDETIMQKIKVSRIDVIRDLKEPLAATMCDFGDYDEELTARLRLNTLKRSALDTTYVKAKQIIADQNLNSKEGYYGLCEIDNRLPYDPEMTYGEKFINWVDYLTIDKSKYYTIEECKTKIAESMNQSMSQNQLHLDIICKQLCSKDAKFPASDLWEEFYDTPVHELIKFKCKKRSGL